jgi:hypothetical protein
MSETAKDKNQTLDHVVSYSLFDEAYHLFFNFVADLEYAARAIGAIEDTTRADFVIQRMVTSAQDELESLWAKGAEERHEVSRSHGGA